MGYRNSGSQCYAVYAIYCCNIGMLNLNHSLVVRS